MSTGSTPNDHPTETGETPETVPAGRTTRRRTSTAARTQPPPAPEPVLDTSPSAETTANTPVAGGEEIIAAASWRPGFGIRAALHNDLATVNVPLVGAVTLPGFAHLAWYAGVAALVTLEIVEPPVAALIVVAKALADSRHHELLRSFGEGVEAGI